MLVVSAHPADFCSRAGGTLTHCVHAGWAVGRMMGLDDNPLHMSEERMELLASEIAGFNPDFVLTHWKDEQNYASHWITAQSVIRAVQMAYVSWGSRVGFIPDYYVDITNVFEPKMEAVKKLETQPQLVEFYSTSARWRGLEACCRYAAGFIRWAPKSSLQETIDCWRPC